MQSIVKMRITYLNRKIEGMCEASLATGFAEKAIEPFGESIYHCIVVGRVVGDHSENLGG